ncbi:MAG: cytochrome c3 family protein [Acidobacteria bacterium]|nr:cytochrome c3 family protein [Acidobacteriota bacterium]
MRFKWEVSRNFLQYSKFILPVGLVAVLATVLGVGWYTQPDRFVRGYEPVQPIPYSHALHPGTLRIPCQYCHSGAAGSRYAGIPAVEKCMNCHSVTRTDSPEIRKLAALYESGEPLQWERIHSLPDHAYFDHRPHVNAGILCQTCHGEVQTMDVVYQNMSMRMSNCLGCHRDPEYALQAGSTIVKGPEHCYACHR